MPRKVSDLSNEELALLMRSFVSVIRDELKNCNVSDDISKSTLIGCHVLLEAAQRLTAPA